MSNTIEGIHHVTAITADAQRNVDFYSSVLGLRLVKRTVNFDDPGAYHLYYGDGLGSPGTIMTFFAIPGAGAGRPGNGQINATAFAIAPAALDYWTDRLAAHGVPIEGPTQRFAEQVLTVTDPDGLGIELIAHPHAPAERAWRDGPVPVEHAIRGLHSVTLWEQSRQRTADLLTRTLGFRQVAEDGDVVRYAVADGGPSALVDVRVAPDAGRGVVAAGAVHHVAWRTPGDAEQAHWRETIAARGLHVTPVMDRQYFHSIYFREPGGVLFEIATDPPGFAIDEAPAELGAGLMLPPWLEPRRDAIERVLPPLRLPTTTGVH